MPNLWIQNARVIYPAAQRAARKPELEHELLRDPRLGFEPAGGGTVRCLQHGVPWPFDCWHYHDEYELQIINRTTGQ
eukprot:gene11094-14096_t